MSAVVWSEVQAIGNVVGQVNDTGAIEDCVLAQVLLVATQNVRRCGDQCLHPVVKSILVHFAEVVRLANA